MNSATTFDDEEPLFNEKVSSPLLHADDVNLSESDMDEDDLSSFGEDALDHLNLPTNLKNILRMVGSEKQALLDGDDSESDDDTLQKLHSLDLDKVNERIAKSKNKFMDFGAEKEEEQQETEKVKRKRTKKPQEKKRRRDKGKEKDILQELEDNQTDRLQDILSRMRQMGDDESDEDEVRVQKKQKKKSGRKSRKKDSTEGAIDENGERMIRTTSLLDDSSSSSEEEKPLSKKQEEEMYKENERLRRNKKVGLKPVYNTKSFDDFVKRRDEKEEQYLKQQQLEKQKPSIPNSVPVDDDSDSDIEILNDPKKIAAKLVSPVRYPMSSLSPLKSKSQSSFKEFNRRMLEKITNQGYEYRMKMEAAAKAKGQYASATERAKRLLEREKDALMINQQINQHFEKRKQEEIDLDSDEEDEDYEEGQEDDDILNEYSGSEEEFEVEDADETNKRKLDDDDDTPMGDEDDEDDMAVGAFKRWKNKKMKKSIFDEDDDDEPKAAKKKSAPQPEPKHSIANFFKSKEKENDDKSDEAAESKPLSRLMQKETKKSIVEQPKSEGTADHDDLDNEADDMDVDEIVPPKPVKEKRAPIDPKEKLEYLEEEAEEEEDEFFGAGGEDGEGEENLDEFEKDDLLVEDNNEHVDEAALRDAFNKQDEESDKNLIQRLITDITSGGLRKQKAAAEAGLMLEDIDLYDEEDNDLVAIRRLQAARRRKLLKMRGGDTLENLLKDPKTAAFAKAFQAIPDAPIVILSDEEDGQEEAVKEKQPVAEESQEQVQIKVSKRIIISDDEDEEEDDSNPNVVDFSDEDDFGISELDEMATPLRGDLLGLDDDEGDIDDFQIETMRSPVAARKAKSIFSSPSNMDRFKRAIAEASNAVNGNTDSGGPRIGFGSVKNVK